MNLFKKKEQKMKREEGQNTWKNTGRPCRYERQKPNSPFRNQHLIRNWARAWIWRPTV